MFYSMIEGIVVMKIVLSSRFFFFFVVCSEYCI